MPNQGVCPNKGLETRGSFGTFLIPFSNWGPSRAS